MVPIFNGDLEDLESFQTCIEEVKTDMSKTNPSLYEVLGEITSSKQPIEEGDISQIFQSILREKHRALRVLQEKHKGIQLGCLLVQKTKGETQLEVTRWFQTANSWEAWRQLNLQYTTSKWNLHFKLLVSLMNINFDDQPASCLQHFNAWKDQVVRYQQHVGEQLPDFIKLLAVVNGLKGSVRNLVLLNIDSASSFGDLDSLLGKYFNNTYVPSESSLNSVWDKAWRDKQKGKSKGKGKKPNPYYKQKLGRGGKRPQPSAYKGKGKPAQLPTRNQWCSICWKNSKGTEPKLAGGTQTSSSSSSTNRRQLGTTQASSSNGLHKL